MNSIKNSFPFYEKIINLLFWSNEELSADEIFERTKQEYSPIQFGSNICLRTKWFTIWQRLICLVLQDKNEYKLHSLIS